MTPLKPIPVVSRHPESRLDAIALARRTLLQERAALPAGWIAPWIERSWRRCLQLGLKTQERVVFDLVSPAQMLRTLEANQQLLRSAKPVLENLGRAIVNTRYFAILTNRDGVVVDASGAIDRSDPRANNITRVGADLSERSIGTSAIGAALTDLQPVWLHRGEHYFSDTSVYSCAGAPVFGPDGQCVGMLDLTGIDAMERPELKHLVTQSASKIENALLLDQPHHLLLRLNWPGNTLGSDSDGLVGLDADGWVTGANPVARQMLPKLSESYSQQLHVGDVFGIPFELFFDAARRDQACLEIPLWTGLRLQAMALERQFEAQPLTTGMHGGAEAKLPLKDMETALIRKAVAQARGNVAEAARLLGISRATVYRKLGQH